MNWVSKQANINVESRCFDVIVTGYRDGAVVRALACGLFLERLWPVSRKSRDFSGALRVT